MYKSHAVSVNYPGSGYRSLIDYVGVKPGDVGTVTSASGETLSIPIPSFASPMNVQSVPYDHVPYIGTPLDLSHGLSSDQLTSGYFGVNNAYPGACSTFRKRGCDGTVPCHTIPINDRVDCNAPPMPGPGPPPMPGPGPPPTPVPWRDRVDLCRPCGLRGQSPVKCGAGLSCNFDDVPAGQVGAMGRCVPQGVSAKDVCPSRPSPSPLRPGEDGGGIYHPSQSPLMPGEGGMGIYHPSPSPGGPLMPGEGGGGIYHPSLRESGDGIYHPSLRESGDDMDRQSE